MTRAKQPKPVPQMTIPQFEDMFPDEDACAEYLIARRWAGEVRCPRCGNTKVYALASGRHWQCHNCNPSGYRFSHISGTVFENTKKPLREWYRVIHMMLTSKKGVSALQVQRVMGFKSYETAHYMCHRIRAALVEQDMDKLGGVVEVDETFVGGKDHNRHWDKKSGGTGGSASNKFIIIGAVERNGNAVTRVIERTDTATFDRFVRETVSDKVSLLTTDEHSGYRMLKDVYPHQFVRHGAGQYVTGAVHTNTIEGYWSIFKRGVVGTFHKVSRKYLPLYIAEFQFRYNNRMNSDIFGSAVSRV